jgi:predicted permease
MRAVLQRASEWIQRLWGTLTRRRTDADLQAELQAHLDLAREAGDRDARAVAGGVAPAMDHLRDQRGLPWLDALMSDVKFGWRRLRKTPRSSLTAILSLALAIGATTGAFRLIDALLLRPLPVSEPHRLFAVGTTSLDTSTKQWDLREEFDYPSYVAFSQALGEDADAMVAGMTYPGRFILYPGADPEVVPRQLVSGNFFGTLGLTPAAGRLLTPADDDNAAAAPVAVLGYDFWRRRFGGDPAVVGRRIHSGKQPIEIVGVASKGFTGTEPGSITDLYMPARYNRQALDNRNWTWMRIWLRAAPGVSEERIEQRLQAALHHQLLEHVKTLPPGTPKDEIDAYLSGGARLLPASAGSSRLQKTFSTPLWVLLALAGLVLVVACVNVASTQLSQSMARQHEMALRVSIGASRSRLVRLLLIESSLLAGAAAVLGVLFATWAAPIVVLMISDAERPVRLVLDLDWRALTASGLLAIVVTLLFGLLPAARASSIRPLGLLRAIQPPRSRRLAHALVAGQMAFSVALLFVTGLFVASFIRISTRPLGFAPDKLLVLQTEGRTAHPPAVWTTMLAELSRTPGVESASMAGWAPLSGNRWTGRVRVEGRTVEGESPFFLDVSAGYFKTLGLQLTRGRDFGPDDQAPAVTDDKRPRAGVAVVNEVFARAYFGGADPIGRRFYVGPRDVDVPVEIVGLVSNAAYLSVKEDLRPTVYVPIDPRENGAIFVRAAGDPASMGATLSREIARIRPDLRVTGVQPQSLLVSRQLRQDRVLATISVFFAAVAVLIAGIGLYGVVSQSVVHQQRDMAIRMALGARALQVIGSTAGRIAIAASAGGLIGLVLGVLASRPIESLLFQASSGEVTSLAGPLAALVLVMALSALPPLVRAIRINPVRALRE